MNQLNKKMFFQSTLNIISICIYIHRDSNWGDIFRNKFFTMF